MPRGRSRDQLLSCERMLARFGSYGVEVLESDTRHRVSSLYSLTDGAKTCRTYAEVRFLQSHDPAVAVEHARVVAGESIGTVFRSAGWTIVKRHIHIGEITVSVSAHALARLMQIEHPRTLATHTYVFQVGRHGRRLDYALITETHHPAYLTLADLAAIYDTVEGSPLSIES